MNGAIKFLRLLVIGGVFLFFGIKMFVDEHKQYEAVAQQYAPYKGVITDVKTYWEDDKTNSLAQYQGIIIELDHAKKFRSLRAMGINDADNALASKNGGQKALQTGNTVEVLYEKTTRNGDGIPTFVNLSYNGNNLLKVEDAVAGFKGSNMKYMLLVPGILLTGLSVFIIISFVKKSRQQAVPAEEVVA